jgi:3-dehydroquinate dehydratase
VGELPDLVDIRILVDGHGRYQTVEVARRLGLIVSQHDHSPAKPATPWKA